MCVIKRLTYIKNKMFVLVQHLIITKFDCDENEDFSGITQNIW